MEVRRFTELLEDDERRAGIKDAMAWGYPREIEEREIGASVWVRYGPDCIFWLNGVSEDELGLHIAIRPESRGSLSGRRLFIGIETIAQLCGATNLRALLPPGSEPLRLYLHRLGWRDYEGGMIRNLGR